MVLSPPPLDPLLVIFVIAPIFRIFLSHSLIFSSFSFIPVGEMKSVVVVCCSLVITWCVVTHAQTDGFDFQTFLSVSNKDIVVFALV